MFAVFDITNLTAILFLVFLEGILSMDNALVLALMVRHLPKVQQKRALTYGIFGAFLFRFVSLFFLSHLMGVNWIKWLGGGYLIFISLKHFIYPGESDAQSSGKAFGFWRTILMVELMDMAFSVDSILAAVSLSKNYFVVMIGGLLGIVMMRFAATLFIRLIAAFPRIESTAYLLVFIIGLKLVIQGMDISWIDFHDSKNFASWAFWLLMAGAIAQGFRGRKPSLA